IMRRDSQSAGLSAATKLQLSCSVNLGQELYAGVAGTKRATKRRSVALQFVRIRTIMTSLQMITPRERMTRGARLGTVTSIGGVAGILICGISIFIGGIAGTFTVRNIIRRGSNDPGVQRSLSGFFSGDPASVRVFFSPTPD